MSSKKEEKGQAATDRLKAAALSAAKGLSRTQAEKAAAAATRNVNAYGQKEEGPSRWQERKEQKRQMYLMSTEKAVRLGVRKDPKANIASMGAVASQCQKCFQPGHWTYECKGERVYISRPSRTQLLKNPKLRQKMMSSYTEDNPDIIKEQEEEEEEKKKDEKVEKRRKKSKRKYKSDTESSRSEGSESESDSRSSASGSDESGSSYSSSSDSEEERRRRRKDKKKQDKGGRKSKSKSKRYSSSSASESSDYESSSDSDSEGRKRRKSGKHSRRR